MRLLWKKGRKIRSTERFKTSANLFFLSLFFSSLFLFFVVVVFVTGICVHFLSYTAFSAVGIRARLSVFAFFLSFLMSSDAKEHIRDKLRCRPTGAVASAQPRESAAIFP